MNSPPRDKILKKIWLSLNLPEMIIDIPCGDFLNA